MRGGSRWFTLHVVYIRLLLLTDCKRPRDTHRTRSIQGIPLDMIMKLNAITNERQLFDEFIEDGQSPKRVPMIDAEYLTEYADRAIKSPVRVGRFTNSEQSAKNTENDNEPDDDKPVIALASLGVTSSRINRLVSSTPVNNRMRTNSSSDSQKNSDNTKKTAIVPKFAACIPELRTVNLKDTDDPTLYYYPSCTRVDRCGGCCSHELLSCQPISRELVNFTVHLSKYVGKPKMEYRGTKIITVEKHLKCDCECKVKAHDCTQHQNYEENDCRCVCTNKDDEAKCSQEEKTKLWNPSTCTCQCREVHECSSGFYFDQYQCICVKSRKILVPDYSYETSRY